MIARAAALLLLATSGIAVARDLPFRDPAQPVPVSASVLESMQVCPTQWFLEREAGGVARAHQSANLGELLHALAERVASGELTAARQAIQLVELPPQASVRELARGRDCDRNVGSCVSAKCAARRRSPRRPAFAKCAARNHLLDNLGTRLDRGAR